MKKHQLIKLILFLGTECCVKFTVPVGFQLTLSNQNVPLLLTLGFHGASLKSEFRGTALPPLSSSASRGFLFRPLNLPLFHSLLKKQ